VRLGVHVSIGKGFIGALHQAQECGCDCYQIFAGNPRGWARKTLPEDDFLSFQAARIKTTMNPIVVHAPYLPNPTSEKPDLYEKTKTLLLEDFSRANKLGTDYFVLHPGHSNTPGYVERVANMVNLILKETPGETVLLLENQAGSKNESAATFREMGQLLNAIERTERVGVCFDTCHAFAAGYDLRDKAGWTTVLDEFDRFIGLSKLKLFHINDSRGELGSGLDRHDHIGQGTIGLPGFEFLLNHPQLSQLPGILETPQDNPDDDRKNLMALRSLIKEFQ
jgi:deoxyribonuclease-4